ncbi:MAG TPA: filamentous hemagglutinin family protein, partial [Geobacteraceae bacterium]|nr:filamentous hemagglutinin family protein [Geobacteraceae bacterium]
NIEVTAQGNVTLGTAVNPTIVSGIFGYTDSGSGQANWDLDPGYMNSSLRLNAVNGDVYILGNTSLYPSMTDNNPSTMQDLKSILPPTLEAYAGGSIRLLEASSTVGIVLAPSPTGTLRLVAGLDITGYLSMSDGTFRRGAIYVSDMNPSQVYGSHQSFQVTQLFTNSYHDAPVPLHANDADNPNVLTANLDISDLRLYLPKETQIQAGQNITDIYVDGQNVKSSALSSIIAGGNITLSNLFSSNEPFSNGVQSSIIEEGGPGNFLFMAGGSIDLGNTQGIQEVGNTINHALPEEKSGLYVVVGGSPDLTTNQIATFFPLLQDAGQNYSNLLAAGETTKAQQVVNEFRNGEIVPLFINANWNSGSGQINMVSSQISTLGNNGDIYIVAGGDINVGKSAINLDKKAAAQETQSTGIFTASGGMINIFAKGNVNVNESRVMTFRGGDITVWSDEGSINAGRGSKTAISALPPQSVPQYDQNGNITGYTTVFTPPSVGSGIRAVTYDPDGPAGPLTAPPPGDIYLFAPQGVIDAGEAGIAGGKVILGATEVLNAKNISFSVGSVGVPTSSEAGVSLGSLAGAGTISEAAKMGTQSTLSAAQDKVTKQTNAVSDFLAKWLDVKVISIDPDSEPIGGDQQDTPEKEKKKRGK